MSHSKRNAPDQEYDPETGEISEDENPSRIFGAEGPQPDGSTIIPVISMSNIRCKPELAKLLDRPVKMAMVTGVAGGELLMPKMGEEAKMAELAPDHNDRMRFTALVATIEPWGAVRYDEQGEPEAVFKADNLFLPTYHQAVLKRMRQLGQVAIAFEFWAVPKAVPLGYGWHLRNLAQYDANGSPIDRLMQLGVVHGKMLENAGEPVGILAALKKASAEMPRQLTYQANELPPLVS